MKYEIYAARIFGVMPIAEVLIGGYCLYLFAKPFMGNKIRAVCAGASYFLTMLLLYTVPLYFYKDTAYIIGSITAFLVMCLMERKNYEQEAFIAVTFFSLHWFAYAMADILRDKLYDAALKTDYPAAQPKLWFALYVVMCTFWLLLEFLFMAFSIRCILRSCAYKLEELSKKELLVLSVPSLMGVLGFESMWYYRNAYMSESGKPSDIYDALTVFYCVAAVIAIVVVIVLYQGIRAQQAEKLQNQLLAAQLESMRHHIGQVEELYQNIRSIRHDMTNHILTLEGLYAADTEAAGEYAARLKTLLLGMEGGVKSGNPITDVILLEAKHEAEKRSISFRSDFHYPSDSNIEAFDVSVILNNALQNAMEHVQGGEHAHISVRSYRKNNAYMIEISNSFFGSLEWDAQSGLPLTSKKEKDSHGYGLSNIRRVAEKYFGDIDITIKDGEFCLGILLMLE